jgi:DNA (cytosine-5)-methyltransferase 1
MKQGTYYNEFDPVAAESIRVLMKQGLINQGEVDERSITEVQPDDVRGFKRCHFFAGIAGWELALQYAGWDDREVWTGSCPCQSFSAAGKGRGFDDERDLWPIFANLICECQPAIVFGEQVESAISFGWLDRVYGDLEAEGYAVGAHVLGAHSVGAPHIRQRLYWGAISKGYKQCGEAGGLADTGLLGQEERQKQAAGYKQCGEAGGLADTELHGHSATEDGRSISKEQTEGRLLESKGTCDDGRMADTDCEGSQGGLSWWPDQERQTVDESTGHDSTTPVDWRDAVWWPCRDGKCRRIQAQSVLFSMVDGVPSKVVLGNPEDGFPLAEKQEGSAGALKCFGNAIVPQVVGVFIEEFMQATRWNNE